jgi:uncharacterized membrane protein
MFGLSSTDASSASLLLNLEGVATMAIAWFVFRENVDSRLLVGAVAILAGAVLLSWSGEGLRLSWGSLLIAGACLAWGIDNNLTRKLSASDPVQVAAIKGLAAGAVNTGLAIYLGAPMVSPTVAVAGAVVGFFGIGVSLVFFMLGLRHLGTARTGAYFSLAPFIGAMLSIVMLGDALTLWLVIAGVLMAIGRVARRTRSGTGLCRCHVPRGRGRAGRHRRDRRPCAELGRRLDRTARCAADGGQPLARHHGGRGIDRHRPSRTLPLVGVHNSAGNVYLTLIA